MKAMKEALVLGMRQEIGQKIDGLREDVAQKIGGLREDVI
jgi:hypothetical protein